MGERCERYVAVDQVDDRRAFGNLWTQAVTKRTAPSVSLSVDMATNRLNSSGWSYDGYGNATSMLSGGRRSGHVGS